MREIEVENVFSLSSMMLSVYSAISALRSYDCHVGSYRELTRLSCALGVVDYGNTLDVLFNLSYRIFCIHLWFCLVPIN